MMFSKIITTDDEKNKKKRWKLFIKFHSVPSERGWGDEGRCSLALPASRAEDRRMRKNSNLPGMIQGWRV